MTVVIDADTVTFTVGIGHFILVLAAAGGLLCGAVWGVMRLTLKHALSLHAAKIHQDILKLKINVRWIKKWIKRGQSGQELALLPPPDTSPENE